MATNAIAARFITSFPPDVKEHETEIARDALATTAVNTVETESTRSSVRMMCTRKLLRWRQQLVAETASAFGVV